MALGALCSHSCSKLSRYFLIICRGSPSAADEPDVVLNVGESSATIMCDDSAGALGPLALALEDWLSQKPSRGVPSGDNESLAASNFPGAFSR